MYHVPEYIQWHHHMTLDQLIQQAHSLIGLTAQELAEQLNQPMPADLKQAKGWLGQTLEKVLGATANSRPLPDFVELGIELKTLPVTLKGEPKESTYICVAPIPNLEPTWSDSLVHRKTAHILWIPILADRTLPFPKHQILTPFLWKPSQTISDVLARDWEELTTALNTGHLAELSASQGEYLHIRPKALNSQVQIQRLDQNAELIQTVPKGFYFRRQLTQLILNHYFMI